MARQGDNGPWSIHNATDYCRDSEALQRLHAEHERIGEMVGEYDPSVRDPSLAMLKIVERGWDDTRLEEGCKLVQQGIGIKSAARQAGVLVGDLKMYWEEHYQDMGSDDDYSDDDPYA